MRRAISVLLIATVAAFGLAACGGSDDSSPPTKAEYKQQYATLSKQLGAVSAVVSKAINESAGKSNKKLEQIFSDAADQTRDVANKFEDTTPPDDARIQAQVKKLVAGLGVAADDLDAISRAAGKNDLKGAGEAAAKLTRDDAGVASPKGQLDILVLGVKPPKQTTTTTSTKQK